MTNLCINIYIFINNFIILKKGDYILNNKNFLFVICVILISVLLFSINIFISHNGDTVYIYYDSQLFETAPLNENREINVNDTNVVVIENGSVYMKSATCPDKLCINQGKISDSSRNIVCLPNKVVVKVDKASDIDAVSQ